MKATWTVFRKELRTYLVSPIPYVLLCLFGIFVGYFFFDEFYERSRASLEQLFGLFPWAIAILVPALTMRLWSEELRGGTVETLLTMPVRSSALVMGKFLAGWVLVIACLVATLPILITVASLGDVDYGPVWTGYLGAALMAAALLALGMWVSALTRHQVVAFLVALGAGLVLVFMGRNAQDAGPSLSGVFEQISVEARYRALGRGVVDFRDVLYFASFAGLFLYLNAQAVENRRYR
jgi:gliding motility-associated transport system permease protein